MSTNASALNFDLVRTESLRSQIAGKLRAQIVRGELADGEKLPPARELGEHWGTDPATVHAALARLATEGLLERTPRVGTFVRSPRRALRNVAIYASSNWLVSGYSSFRFSLFHHLGKELLERDAESSVFLDARSEEEQSVELNSLRRASDEREVQAAILITGDPRHNKWFHQLPMPTVSFGGPPLNTVQVDHRSFLRMALSTLARQGCRTIGVIDGVIAAQTSYYSDLLEIAGEFDLEVANHSTAIPQFHLASTVQHAEFGYNSFHKLDKAGPLPDGLLLYPDTVASGAITAMLEFGVHSPEDVKLVVHRNIGIPLLCPFEATFIEFDVAAAARVLLDQAAGLLAGKPAETVYLSHKFASNTSKAH